HIFRRYIELGSVHVLARQLVREGIRSKRWTTSKGEARGGVLLSRGALFHMLRNRLYLGEIVHKDVSYPGQHQAIVDAETFAAAGRLLDAAPVRQKKRVVDAAPLTGLLFDTAGNRMTPVHSKGRSGKRYRYYISGPLQTGGEVPRDIPRRVPASRIEDLLISHLRQWSMRPEADWQVFLPWIRKIEVHASALVTMLVPPLHERWGDRVDHPIYAESIARGELRVTIPATIILRGGRSRVTGTGFTRTNPDRALIAGLRRAHITLREHGVDLIEKGFGFDNAKGIADPYLRSLSSLAFLAPDIQQAILTGRQPDGMLLAELLRSDLPLCWQRQREMFGM
ncbi:MAG TPA: recombinase family protein, partial [Novosphingobium sp.]